MAMRGQEQQHSKHFSPIRLEILIIAVLFIIVGTLVGILNILGNIHGSWATIISFLFTALGVVLALFQWLYPFSSEVNQVPGTSKPGHRSPLMEVAGVDLKVSKQTGALVVFTPKKWRGKTVYLVTGDYKNPDTKLIANIVEHKVNGRTVFAAVFPGLAPGNYTFYRYLRWEFTKESNYYYVRNITVFPGNIARIDLRSVRYHG